MLEIPLEQHNRQSVVVRLDAIDVKVRVSYSPVSKSWFADIEAPNGKVVVQGRRVTVNTPLIGGAVSPLQGDIWCRMKGGTTQYDPQRQPWGDNGTHRLAYEAKP